MSQKKGWGINDICYWVWKSIIQCYTGRWIIKLFCVLGLIDFRECHKGWMLLIGLQSKWVCNSLSSVFAVQEIQWEEKSSVNELLFQESAVAERILCVYLLPTILKFWHHFLPKERLPLTFLNYFAFLSYIINLNTPDMIFLKLNTLLCMRNKFVEYTQKVKSLDGAACCSYCPLQWVVRPMFF